ncbi:hypothetical protein RFI_05481 [Reticulomyxa filosa]|uniref:AP complex subunit beta n=1 Tax=Reticulomyxa filosa TaxID=46433 RepID=X6P0H6_RETFI|nr:hypothetical protein RFI_05481 [Reticulomyxa filosa]|eukprot:ETO31638.1 hypothetical protein RFI_05481 [Reticulomyxa filosa]
MKSGVFFFLDVSFKRRLYVDLGFEVKFLIVTQKRERKKKSLWEKRHIIKKKDRKYIMSGDGSYFVDHKRGEVLELKQQLRNSKLDQDPKAKREVIKKVIAYMTLGIDVSSLFSDMVMATNTRDFVQKKMVYLYLCTYAEKQPDVALLAVNTLQRDCKDDDPMIRGFALRYLCSLRVGNLVEYIMTPIRNGLTDASAYVRKTAVMGVGKLFAIAPDMVKKSDLIDILYNIIKDNDPGVCINAVHALNEILVDEGGMSVNRSIVHHLLNRLHTLNEWGQVTVLSVVAKYEPSENKEIFDIMNLLEDRLRHSNSALVLAVIKVFLKLTENLPKIHKEVYSRIKTPLLTLLSNPNHSLAYPVVAHMALLVRKKPQLFGDCYKHFYCRYNDLSCVKELKVEMLANVANKSNAVEILAELSEYITDVQVEIARLAVQSIGKIAIRVEDSLNTALQHLISFLEMSQDYVISETCVCVKNILRKYPQTYEQILQQLKSNMRNVEEENGKCAVLWLLGEYGDTFTEAPYILEEYIDEYANEQSSQVKLELLSATMKLFFKTPGEVQAMLGRLLAKAIQDTTKIHVRDRAVFYYRLLQTDVNKAAKIINTPKTVVDVFEDPADRKITKRIFDEFNSLAVVYRKPSELFVSEEIPELEDSEDEEEVDDEKLNETTKTQDSTDNVNNHQNHSNDADTNEQLTDQLETTDNIANNKNNNAGDLLGLEDNNDNLLSLQTDSILTLNTEPQCTPQQFQQAWKQLSVVSNTSRRLKNASNAQQIESYLKNANFRTVASGTVNVQMKLYLYCQEVYANLTLQVFFIILFFFFFFLLRQQISGELHFVEIVANLSNGDCKITFKGQSERNSQVADIFFQTLGNLFA